MNNKLPFDAAIFDLDGTLLDSMYVWAHVDRLFFERRNLRVPADYGAALAGLSYRESAEYTIKRFGFPESWQEIVAEWTQLSAEEYACRVPLKPGAYRYLRRLKNAGVKLAVATALPEYLYQPCLKRLGIDHWFAALCSTDETGGRGKAGGEVYLLAAERLQVAPARACVFEDVLEGIRGAKAVGMRAVCVRDAAAQAAHEEIATVADAMVDRLDELEDELPATPPRRCVIFTAHCEGDPSLAYADRRANDLILCADAGYKTAQALGLEIACVLGDFDTDVPPDDLPVRRYPVVKDDSDAMLCIKYALDLGIDDILLIGGFGGRLDHTLANLQSLNYIAAREARSEMRDGRRTAWALRDGTLKIARTPGKLSLFALGGECTGITLTGAKYNLENARLAGDFPLGMGNDFSAECAEITVRHGTLTILRDEKTE